MSLQQDLKRRQENDTLSHSPIVRTQSSSIGKYAVGLIGLQMLILPALVYLSSPQWFSGKELARDEKVTVVQPDPVITVAPETVMEERKSDEPVAMSADAVLPAKDDRGQEMQDESITGKLLQMTMNQKMVQDQPDIITTPATLPQVTRSMNIEHSGEASSKLQSLLDPWVQMGLKQVSKDDVNTIVQQDGLSLMLIEAILRDQPYNEQTARFISQLQAQYDNNESAVVIMTRFLLKYNRTQDAMNMIKAFSINHQSDIYKAMLKAESSAAERRSFIASSAFLQDFSQALRAKGYLFNRYRDALMSNDYEVLSELAPGYLSHVFIMGLYEMPQFTAKQKEWVRLAVEGVPVQVPYYVHDIAKFDLHNRNAARALKFLNKTVNKQKLQVEEHIDVFGLLAYANLVTKNYNVAIDNYQELLGIRNDNAHWWLGLATAMMETGRRPSEYRYAFQQALDFAPKDASYLGYVRQVLDQSQNIL